jgi:hypothetical protein
MALSRIDTTNMIEDVPQSKLDNNVNFRNIIINGDMSIAQRATSTSSISTTGNFVLDRWRLNVANMGAWTVSQSTDVPTGQGFANSMKWDCTTADASPSADDNLQFQQRFEGQNLQYLKKGTSSADSTTLSFWVKSNKTGTYIIEFLDTDNTRSISKSYTINNSSTWEKKTITFAGDTSGVLNNDNAESLRMLWWLGAGSTYTSGTLQTSWGSQVAANRAVGQVNLADSTSNEWYITGVQLEAGTTASDFEFLPVDVNLQRCLRYFYVHVDGTDKHISMAAAYNTNYVVSEIQYPVLMRTVPSLIQVTGTNYYIFYRDASSNKFDQFNASGARATTKGLNLETSSNISGTAGSGGIIATYNASAKLSVDAEL